MRYLLFIITIMVTLFIGCGKDEKEPATDLCKNKVCEEWEECLNTTGTCVAKEGFCSQNGDCIGIDAYCDETTHICKVNELCNDIVCENWQECKFGICRTKEGFCENDGECSGSGYFCSDEIHECVNKEILCENIDCGGALAGNCIIEDKKAKCKCNTGYFNKTNLSCLEDNCINRSIIGHTEESATDIMEALIPDSNSVNFNEESGYAICVGYKNIYKFTGEQGFFTNHVIYKKAFSFKIYKGSISPENQLRGVFYDYSEFYHIYNPEGLTYYIVVEFYPNISNNREDSIRFFSSCEALMNKYWYTADGACLDDGKFVQLCSENSHCEKTNYCDTTNGYCVDMPCSIDYDCNSGYRCIDGVCEETGVCSKDGDCPLNAYCIDNACVETERYIDENCEAISARTGKKFLLSYSERKKRYFCEWYKKIDFGEEQVLDFRSDAILDVKWSKHYFEIDNSDSIIDYTVTIKDLDEINDIEVNIYSEKDHALFRNFNLEDVTLYKKPLPAKEKKPVIEVKIGYKECEGFCRTKTPKIYLSPNNIEGCSTNNECTSNYFQYKFDNHIQLQTVCDLDARVCVLNNDRYVIEEGGFCDSYFNCADTENGDEVYCNFNICSTSGYHGCSTIGSFGCGTLHSGEQLVCDGEYCIKACESDFDCSIYEKCNVETMLCY